MPHMWVLFFVVSSGFLAPENVNTIFGFTSIESCEYSRHQLEEKMRLKKSACIEITQELPRPQEHGNDPPPPAIPGSGPPPANTPKE